MTDTATQSKKQPGGGASGEKSAKNIVHEQAILVETIRKELREQRLYENFSINPFVKREILAPKPNVYPEIEQDEIDNAFIDMIRRSNMEPTKKYKYPQTTSQEVGWITTPLMENDKQDRRLNYHRIRSEVSAYAEEYYKMFPKKPAVSRAPGAAGAQAADAQK